MNVRRETLKYLSEYHPPRSETERQLVELWIDSLGVDVIGINDKFEDLGGDSLHAAEMLIAIQDLWGIDLPWDSLDKDTTISTLANLTDQERNKRDTK